MASKSSDNLSNLKLKNYTLPSKETVDKHAFSIVNKDIHFELNSGLLLPPSSPAPDFISLQLNRVSWTFDKIVRELESIPLFVKLSTWGLCIPRSLEPMVGALPLTVPEAGGFNNLRRKWIQGGESSRWSSWTWKQERKEWGEEELRSLKDFDMDKPLKLITMKKK